MSSKDDATPAPVRQLIGRIISFFRQRFCSHVFILADLHIINFDGGERVSWSCAKCGKVFKAHCGLDISPKHGDICPPNAKDQTAGALPDREA